MNDEEITTARSNLPNNYLKILTKTYFQNSNSGVSMKNDFQEIKELINELIEISSKQLNNLNEEVEKL